MISIRHLVPWGLALGLGAFTLAGWTSIPKAPGLDPVILTVLCFNVVVILVALAVEVGRRPYSLHLMHLICLFLFLGASSLLQYSGGRFGVAGPIGGVRPQILPAAAAASLWLAGYLAVYEGQRLFGRRRPPGAVSRFLIRPIPLSRAFALALIGIAGLVYLAAMGLLGVQTRGAALLAIEEFSVEAGAGGLTGPFYVINNLLARPLPMIALLAGLLVLLRARRGRMMIGPLLPFLGVGALLINNPFAASRMFFTCNLYGFAAPFFLRRFKTGWILVVTIVIGLAFLPALSHTRDWFDLESFRASSYASLTSPIHYLATSSDVDSLGMTALCQKWVDRYGHRWGMQILGAALFWFPRTFWPGKPIATGGMVTGELGFEFTNLSPPITAEALVDFGLLGVPILGALFGWILSRIDAAYWAPGRRALGRTYRVIDAIYPFWLVCIVYLTRGDLFASLGFTVGFTFWILPLGVGVLGMRSDAGRVAETVSDSPVPRGLRA